MVESQVVVQMERLDDKAIGCFHVSMTNTTEEASDGQTERSIARVSAQDGYPTGRRLPARRYYLHS